MPLHEDDLNFVVERVSLWLDVCEMCELRAIPRLCYIGEVPVECSYHGSALIWRLFENYPPKDLLIVEGIYRSLIERRLPNVQYVHPVTPGIGRLLRTRYAKQISAALYEAVPLLAATLAPRVAYEKSEAIITVCHGIYWRVAARVSRFLKLPLHLIVHDHVPLTLSASERLRIRICNDFGQTYATAATRFCVSEAMAADYELKFGVAGQVLYPSRARSLPKQAPDAVRHVSVASRGLTGVFAGTVAGSGYVDALVVLAKQLARVGGKLMVYGLLTREEATSLGLNLPNVEFPGLVPAAVLRERCQKEADFLFVPMSFGESDSVNMKLSFPSKLADYTEMGLPLLIRGPQYCSAVQWARKHPGVAEVVETENEEELLQAVKRLSDPRTRGTLAEEAVRIGDRYFSHSRAESMLFSALAGSAA